MTVHTETLLAPVALSNYIDGQWVEGGGAEVCSRNPTRPDELVGQFRYATLEGMEHALASGEKASAMWRAMPIDQRARILRAASQILDHRADIIARDICRELGRPLKACRGEVARASTVLRYFAHDAETATGSVYASPRGSEQIFTERRPLGQVLCITPWNVPLAIPAWKIAPALIHGNTVLWKPSDLTPLIARHLAESLAEAGLPPGVLNLVYAEPEVTESAIRDPRISAVSFTGSTPVGQHLRKVGAEAGIDVLAEMGGKNAAVVLKDADIEWAVDQTVSAAMGWSGQRCTATSRVIIEKPIFEEFLRLFVEKVAALEVGDPSVDPDVGPVVSQRQFDSIATILRAGLAQGGRVVVGGVPERDVNGGYFVKPTVIVDIDVDNPLYREEIFGPVAVIVPAENVADALALANDGPYGLSGSVFTSNLEALSAILDEFDVGVLHVNSESTGADVHVPFGGFGASGTSHKEMGESARDFFTKTRTIYMRAGRP